MPGNDKSYARALALVDELLEADAAARAERLASLPADERALVERLLAADADAGGALDAGIEAIAHTVLAGLADGSGADGAGARGAAGELAGTTIGAFTLGAPLGRGGMGEVYRARRKAGDVEQDVAFKILKRGMDSADLVRRFARERRILAQLQHPNIARFVDGGVADDGRPYYAMDLVEGTPLGVHARDLTARAKVALVAQVAEAVAFAHARLVVHRDLKPSNIFVDTAGRPVVLDFGIAKLLDENDREPDGGRSGDTTVGLYPMSPAYAAPEQILGQPIGVAADVFALGVVLFELLVGALPFARHGQSIEAMVRGLDHESAPAPSTAARRRGDTGRAIVKELDGDLDLVVLRALAREPANRYASMAAFAADLRSWLAHRPIAARPDSLTYRVGRFVRRNRVAVVAGAIGAAGIAAALVVALWQAGVARDHASRADAEARRAEERARFADRVVAFVDSVLVQADPFASNQTGDITVADAVKAAAARIDGELAGEPALQLEVLAVLGSISLGNADGETAARYLERAFELQRTVPGLTLAQRADVYRRVAALRLGQERVDDAIALAQEGLALVAPGLAAGADGVPIDRDAAAAACGLKAALAEGTYYKGEPAKAAVLHAEAVALRRRLDGPSSMELARLLLDATTIAYSTNKYEDAERAIDEAIAIYEKRIAPGDVRLAGLLAMSGLIDRELGRGKEALEKMERGIALARTDTKRPSVLGSQLGAYGDTLGQQGRLDEAWAAHEEALAIMKADARPQHRYVATYHVSLGDIARNQGKWALAAEHHFAASAAFAQAFGPDHVATLTSKATATYETGMGGDAAAAVAAGAAMAKLEPALLVAVNAQGTEAARNRNFRGRLAMRAGKPREAVELLRDAVKVGAEKMSPTSAPYLRIKINLGLALLATRDPGLHAEGAALVRDNLAALEAKGFGWDITAKDAREALAAL